MSTHLVQKAQASKAATAAANLAVVQEVRQKLSTRAVLQLKGTLFDTCNGGTQTWPIGTVL